MSKQPVCILWISCEDALPTDPALYLCFEPDIGPGPDFVFLRWDTDRGWRDDNDNKGFPTHWASLISPKIKWEETVRLTDGFPYG